MKTNDFGVILEDIDSQLKRLAEVMTTLATKEQVGELDEKVSAIDLKTDTIQTAIRYQSTHLNEHEQRLIALEGA